MAKFIIDYTRLNRNDKRSSNSGEGLISPDFTCKIHAASLVEAISKFHATHPDNDRFMYEVNNNFCKEL